MPFRPDVKFYHGAHAALDRMARVTHDVPRMENVEAMPYLLPFQRRDAEGRITSGVVADPTCAKITVHDSGHADSAGWSRPSYVGAWNPQPVGSAASWYALWLAKVTQ